MNDTDIELRFIAIKYGMTQAELDMIHRAILNQSRDTDYILDTVATELIDNRPRIFKKIRDWYNVTSVGRIAPNVYAHSNDTLTALFCETCRASQTRVYTQSIHLFKVCSLCGGQRIPRCSTH